MKTDYNIYLPEKLEHIYRPVKVTILDKTYIICNGWYPVPLDIADLVLEEAHKRWIDPYEVRVEAKKTFKIISDSGSEHTVTLENGVYSCDCKGFMFRRSCSHVEKAKEGVNINVPKDIKRYEWVSDTGKTKHKITVMDGKWKCSCSSKAPECKHIKETREKFSK